MARAREIAGELHFEDPVTHREWTAEYNSGDVMFVDEDGTTFWIRASDAASIGDWLRSRGDFVDWRVDAHGPFSIPRRP
jgi:hypothetical protein